MNPGVLQGRHFFRRCSLATGNDRPRVAHATAGRSSLSGNESDDWLRHIFFRKFRGFLFRRPADFANHHYPISFIIRLEKRERVDMRCSHNRIAADADR